MALPPWLSGKESAWGAGDSGDPGLVPGSGRSAGGGHGDPLQYSCLENPMDRGAWWATVRGVTKSRTQLKWLNSASWLEHMASSSSCSMSDVVISRVHSETTLFPQVCLRPPPPCFQSLQCHCDSSLFREYLWHVTDTLLVSQRMKGKMNGVLLCYSSGSSFPVLGLTAREQCGINQYWPVEVYRVMSSLRCLFMFYLESSKLLGPNEWIFRNLTPEKN